MKKTLFIPLLLFFCIQLQAQEKTYLLFEFMRVSDEQLGSYRDTESFWSKIHEQRAKSGEIQGWDLWYLYPGGEDQDFQYAVVTVYNDPVKMMNGTSLDNIIANAKKAFPKMTEADIRAKLNNTGKSRDLAARMYLELVDGTKAEFKMKVGMIGRIDMMKATGSSSAYEKAELEVYKPIHQKMVTDGAKGHWSMARVILPNGSDAYATHFTFNFFNDWKHVFDVFTYDRGKLSDDIQKKMSEGLKLRDMRMSYMGRLEMTVRP
jgi:hypothetical protein